MDHKHAFCAMRVCQNCANGSEYWVSIVPWIVGTMEFQPAVQSTAIPQSGSGPRPRRHLPLMLRQSPRQSRHHLRLLSLPRLLRPFQRHQVLLLPLLLPLPARPKNGTVPSFPSLVTPHMLPELPRLTPFSHGPSVKSGLFLPPADPCVNVRPVQRVSLFKHRSSSKV